MEVVADVVPHLVLKQTLHACPYQKKPPCMPLSMRLTEREYASEGQRHAAGEMGPQKSHGQAVPRGRGDCEIFGEKRLHEYTTR